MGFNFVPEQPKRMRRMPFVFSVCVHLAVIAGLTYKPEPQLLRPSSSLKGEGGSGPTIALVAPGATVLTAPRIVEEEPKKKSLLAPQKKLKPKTMKPEPQPQMASVDKNMRPGMPGFVLGSLANGMVSDHDVRIALPVHAPDPPIVRNRLPEWIRGDVIVEVTISETGDVTDTVVLETVGYGLEQTIVDTLKQWRWIPATVDGMKVASKQDVRFHFPS